MSVTPCEWAPLADTGSGGMGNAPPDEPAAGPPEAAGVAPAAGLAPGAAPVFAAGPLDPAGAALLLAPAAAGAAPPPDATWPAACPGWAAEA
ncbi:MAG TPA: 2-oxoglutarate dehydrogenase, E2 component, dihydrolipoamide succinyltransferase, partial [Acidimicrobiia bacterium]|nr:2-oxoglutarate dehydrogenase, E2 component, dihydrolipoamide succinyltransferase [Acidimicrobiia bacterium]